MFNWNIRLPIYEQITLRSIKTFEKNMLSVNKIINEQLGSRRLVLLVHMKDTPYEQQTTTVS